MDIPQVIDTGKYHAHNIQTGRVKYLHYHILHVQYDTFSSCMLIRSNSENIGTKMRKSEEKAKNLKIFTRKATYELEKAK